MENQEIDIHEDAGSGNIQPGDRKKQTFPLTSPDADKWEYRLVRPISIPEVAFSLNAAVSSPRCAVEHSACCYISTSTQHYFSLPDSKMIISNIIKSMVVLATVASTAASTHRPSTGNFLP